MSDVTEQAETGSLEPSVETPSQQTSERISRWLTLAANLGVLLGLIVLIVEVRQNAALSRISLEADRAAAQARYEVHISDPVIADVWMKAVYTPKYLTPSELRTMDGIMVGGMMTWEHLMTMRDGGLVDDRRVTQHVENNAPFYFGFAFGKNWWRENAVGWQGSDLYLMADPIVQNVDDRFLLRYYNKLGLSEPNKGSVDPLKLIDRATIEAASAQWVETYNRNNWRALAALFTPEATMMPPNGATVTGRDAIAEWEGDNETGFRIAFKLENIEVSGDLAYVQGRSCVFIPDEADGYAVDLGKFLEVRRRQADDRWLIEADIFNSDLPVGGALLPACPFADMPDRP